MSRWTNSKELTKKWDKYTYTKETFYKIHTGQGDFIIKSHARLNYKETIKNLYKKGYTDISISCLG